MKRSGFKPPSPEKLKELQERKRQRAYTSRASKPRKRKTTQAAKKRRKQGVWATSTADAYFSKWIRERDGKCLRCYTTENLTCSHYHKRAISITRYCPLNCITLCATCHQEWEGPKEGYTDLMINRLGVDGFLELQRKAGRFMKRSEAVAEFKDFYRLST